MAVFRVDSGPERLPELPFTGPHGAGGTSRGCRRRMSVFRRPAAPLPAAAAAEFRRSDSGGP